MNIHDLREAQVRFENRIEEVREDREELYRLRADFVRYFNRNRIRNMHVDDYVSGVDIPETGYNFCYTLERQLGKLGSIIGATAFKFGVYYGRTRSDPEYKYRFTKKFGDNYLDAFSNIKESILHLLKDGENKNLDAIAANQISPMFKGKILSTYFPDRYLNIFSEEHLNYYLIKLDLDTKELTSSDPVYKREILIEFKNQDPIMEKWSVDLFAYFLWNEYPGSLPKEGTKKGETVDLLVDYKTPNFSSNPHAEFIALNILPPNLSISSTRRGGASQGRGNPDYEKEVRILRKLGNRGEKIVMDLESERLKDAGRNDLAKKIERVSLKSDSYGYDILSFENDGTERYIEVKATRSRVGTANFFLTANEFNKAMQLSNYFIYMVYDVMSIYPKVWCIKNPFKPENKDVVKIPVNYHVSINAIKP